MTRNETQAMRKHVTDMLKLMFETRDCKENMCYRCKYYDVCKVMALLLKLIPNEGS